MATRFNVKFKGMDRLMKRLRAEPEKIIRATEAALYIEAEQTMTAAKRLTPVDEGILRASGHVRLPERDLIGRKINVELGFGGPAGTGNQGETNTEDVGYAVPVHENLGARHTVGQAKYLEVPLKRRRSGFKKRIMDRVRRRLKV